MRFAFTLCVLLGALLLACGGDDEEQPAPTPTPESVEHLLARSAVAIESVTSFHFRITHENGGTPLPLNLELDTAEGDVSIPGRLSAEIEAEHTTGLDVSVDLIAIDDETWITNPFSRKWQRLPGAGVSDFANPEALVRGLIGALEEPNLDGRSRLDGVETVKLVAGIDAGLLRDALGVAREGYAVRVEAWLGAEDALPRRIRIVGAIWSGDNADIVRQIDISRYDEPVEINPP